jgi:hypothetical protein
MTLRLGFVGVGKHAQKMRAAFEQAGARVVAYDRHSDDPVVPYWGERMSWQRQLESDKVDAVIACATPDVSLAVAERAAELGKRVCVTKPLRWRREDRPANVWVDLWRRYSPAWQHIRTLPGKLEIVACGHGPWRETHSDLEDYGPHALAFAFDARPELAGAEWLRDWTQGYWKRTAPGVRVICGAGAPELPGRREWSVSIDGEKLWKDELERTAALENFCEAFLRGDAHRTLELSCLAMRVI